MGGATGAARRTTPITGEGNDRKQLHTYSKSNPILGRLHMVQPARRPCNRHFGDGIRVSIGFIVTCAALKVGALAANASEWLVSRREREIVSFELAH